MAITAAVNALILSATITASLDNVDVLALENAGGEFLRKAPETITKITTQKYQYEFYFTEAEGNDTIVGVEINGNGATTTLDDGTAFANQVLNLVKTNTQSLTVIWTLELI